MAARSVKYNNLEDKVSIRQGDIKEAVSIFGAASFHVVTCNPPYMIGQHGLTNPEAPKAIARHEVLCTFEDIAAQTDAQHSKAFDPLGLATDLTLSSMGRHKMRSQGEEHRYNPQTIHMLQQATRDGSYEKFCEYTKMVDKEETGYLRSLMDFNFPETGVPIEEVESVESIVKRFKTGAMSYGSISEEAHEAMAIAMNKLHGKSNSGEGGESDERLESAGTDHDRSSAMKQVSSGRFGVTSRYLGSAR